MKPFEFTPAVDRLIDMALEEDIGPGDITTKHTIPAEAAGHAVIVAKEDLVIAGLAVARRVFERLDGSVDSLDARLAELDEEYRQVRAEVQEMLQGPEWTDQ